MKFLTLMILILNLQHNVWAANGDGSDQMTPQELESLVGEYQGAGCRVEINIIKRTYRVKIISDTPITSWEDSQPGAVQYELTYFQPSIFQLAGQLRGDREYGYFVMLESVNRPLTQKNWFMRLDFKDGKNFDLRSVDMKYSVSGWLDFYKPSRKELSTQCMGLTKIN